MSRYIWPYSYGPPWNQDLAGRHVGGSSQRRHAHGHHLRSGELRKKGGFNMIQPSKMRKIEDLSIKTGQERPLNMVIKMVISSANYERWIGLLWKTRWKTMVFTPSSGGSCRFYLKPILGRVLTGSSWGKHVELEKPWGKHGGSRSSSPARSSLQLCRSWSGHVWSFKKTRL